tara:strand:- start:4124 stop:4339 length:216 start_codon:yes stop_codon:yes gene_type:complete
MKLFTAVLFTLIITFSNANAADKKDCSEFKKLTHKYNMCKAGNLKSGVGNTAGKIKKGTGKFLKKIFGKKN